MEDIRAVSCITRVGQHSHNKRHNNNNTCTLSYERAARSDALPPSVDELKARNATESHTRNQGHSYPQTECKCTKRRRLSPQSARIQKQQDTHCVAFGPNAGTLNVSFHE
jgi:hypothetical protein